MSIVILTELQIFGRKIGHFIVFLPIILHRSSFFPLILRFLTACAHEKKQTGDRSCRDIGTVASVCFI